MLWELPQMIVGYLLIALYKIFMNCRQDIKLTKFREVWVVRLEKHIYWGISMGGIIILGIPEKYEANYTDEPWGKELVNHEYGHTFQSKWLGWLYLIVIGLPSIIACTVLSSNRYQTFYTERWANWLGSRKGLF